MLKETFVMKERMEIKNLDELYEAILHLETVEECNDKPCKPFSFL